jgi:hypothetical protein
MGSSCFRRVPRRAAFGAVAVSTVLLGPPAASAAAGDSLASASAPTRSQLSLNANRETVRYGKRVVLTGKLTAAGKPLAGRVVELHRLGAVDRATTRNDGTVAFKPRPVQTNTYELRFTPATPEDVVAYQASASSPVTVRVRPLVAVKLSSPLRAGRKTVGITRARLRVRGTVVPFTADRVVVRVLKGKREIRRRSRSLTRRGSRGRFSFSFKPSRRGSYVVRASVPAAGNFGASRSRARLVVVRSSAGPGSRGPAVRALQRRLSALGYKTPVSGSFGASTSRAVLAFRKANGMSRNSFASRSVFSSLQRGGGGFRVRYPRAGKHAEFDWSRQLLVLARGAKVVRVVHASSGAPATPTVFGRFRFYSKTPGYNSKSMYYSSYFIGGYAIHGYASVPNFPASHGCIRIPIASAISVYRWIELGNPIYVYR